MVYRIILRIHGGKNVKIIAEYCRTISILSETMKRFCFWVGSGGIKLFYSDPDESQCPLRVLTAFDQSLFSIVNFGVRNRSESFPLIV